ncbi:MAG: glutaredoxin domain-containing protein [Desulfomonilaceae bacterium]
MEIEVDHLVMYGAKWCPDAKRARQFLDERGIAYEWHDIDEEEGARDFVVKVNGRFVIPTLLFPDGTKMTEPSNEQLTEKFGG